MAENPYTPAPVLAKLAEDKNEDVGNPPYLRGMRLLSFQARRTKYVPGYVAENPSTSAELLEKLARDDDVIIRTGAYHNPNATDEIRAQAVLLGIDEEDH